MSMIDSREAARLAAMNAAALVEAMDLEQLFGQDITNQVDTVSGLAELLDQAQKKIVAQIRELERAA
jgi:hypothetical protein